MAVFLSSGNISCCAYGYSSTKIFSHELRIKTETAIQKTL